MKLGVMFFASSGGGLASDRYRLLHDVVQFADRQGFTCVWTPERHFHAFGGLFPNPAVMAAALAMETERLQIRAGSLISPLHDVIRIAEDWSLVDNLSNGRVAVSFGSGWNVDDFVFFPERYAERQRIMYEQIETVRRLWRGETVTRRNSFDKLVKIPLFPRPLQEELPIWVTSSGNPETFASAGRVRANLLTHLIGQDLETLASKIERYRAALAQEHGEDVQGIVSLMLHTFVGPDGDAVRRRVWKPFREYLRSAVSLEQLAARAGGAISGGHEIEAHEIPPDALEDLLDLTVERYLREGSLIGTPQSLEAFVWRLKELGVDEIACLVDFVDDPDAVQESLVYLAELQSAFASG